MRIAPVVFAVLAPLSFPSVAASQAAPSPAQAAFNRLKALEGTWVGKAGPEGVGAPEEASVTYHVTAAGSAVVETLFPGTPHEMVTLYNIDGKDLRLTHYCAMGNQPSMVLKPSPSPTTLVFEFDRGGNMKDGDGHMHAAKLVFPSDNTIESFWTSWEGGKPSTTMHFTMTRKK